MNDKREGGWAVGRAIRMSLVLAFLFLFASGAGATIQQQIDNANPTIEHPIPIVEVLGPGPYNEHLDINKPLILKGISNPVLDNAGPGLEIIDVTSAGVRITGFTITGASGDGVPGILVNGSPDMVKPLVVYNNIYGNGVGVNNPKGVGLVNQLTDDATDAVRNFWGPYGNFADKGKPGAEGPTGHFNNEVDIKTVDYDPWLTAEVTDGNVTNALDQQQFCELTNMLILNNTEAGVDVALSGGDIRYDPEPTSMGSALYNASPYTPVAVPGTAVKYIDVYVRNYQGPAGKASMDIYYNDVDISGIIEDTLTPYVLHDSRWVAASNVVVDNVNQKVSGDFPVGLLDGSPIALVGQVPPVSPIVITSPKAGDTLTRTPWLITWTMPTPENVLSVDLWFARDGDFTMRGGLNNPLHLATLGADTSYLWRSPNFLTDTAKIAVVVVYNDGTQFVGISDNFSLAKGYSFHAYKPTPKTPWQLGSGISHAVAVLGSWFNKPHIPYVIG